MLQFRAKRFRIHIDFFTSKMAGKISLTWANDASGEFIRQVSGFRNWISSSTGSLFQPEANRYHLYVSLACPWAHRTLIVRALKGLEEVISISVVDTLLDENGLRLLLT